jgi:enterochelin esterase-like enzyme
MKTILMACGLVLVPTLVWAAEESQSKPLPAAPHGFDARREKIEHGKLATLEYDSKATGGKRKMVIYTPPGYSKDANYPVLYLLHGAGDDETGWTVKGAAAEILDNLYAEKKLAPMIVVMPNGFARPAGTPDAGGNQGGPPGQPGRARGAGRNNAFEPDLLKDIIPYIDAHYPVKNGSENRAIAGLSMGGGQALRIGLKHLDTFAWVAGFSSAIFGGNRGGNSGDVVPADTKALRLLWLSCGDADRLMTSSKAFHTSLAEKKVPHVWHVDTGGHEWPVWKNDLYLLAPMLFRDKAADK